MQVEDVAGIGLAAGRAAQQQRHLAIGDGLLGQIVVDDHGMHAVVAEELAHGAAGIGREELQRRRLRGGGGDDDRIIERAAVVELLDDLGHGRPLLADGDVDAIELLRFVAAGIDRLLVDDGVDRHRGLAGLAVADDQLALAAADRHQAVDRLEAGLHRFVHRLARDDAGRLDLDAHAGDVGELALAVDRVAQRIDHPAEQAAADRHVDDRAGALDRVAFLDVAVVAEDDDADIVGFEVERHAAHAAGKLDHLAGLDLVEAIDPGHAVAHRQHLADLGDIRLGTEILDLLLQDRGDLRGADLHYPTPFIVNCRRCSLLRSELSTMRLPTLTTSPPIRPASILASTATLPPTARCTASATAWRWRSSSGRAEVTWAVISPRRWASCAR